MFISFPGIKTIGRMALLLTLIGGAGLDVAAATDLKLGLRYDQARNGHGLSVHRLGHNYIVFFYTYQADGSPDWYLCTGPMLNGAISGDCNRFVRSADDRVEAEPAALGSFFLDFVNAAEHRACSDSVDRADAEDLAVFAWSKSKTEYIEHCTEYLQFGNEYPDPYYGGVWYGQDDGRYGCTISHRDSVSAAICYYYDGAGQPRWALGVADSTEPRIELVHYDGYCRQCEMQPLVARSAGTLTLQWDHPAAPTGSFGLAQLDLVYPTGAGGQFNQSFALHRISDGQTLGEHAIGESPTLGAAQLQQANGDLDQFVNQLLVQHPDPFHGLSLAQFEGLVEAIRNRLPLLKRTQFIVEIARVAAQLSRRGRDGHTNAIPLASSMLPLQLYRFADGMFVVDALPPHEGLIGQRIESVGDLPMVDVERWFELLAPRDNGSTVDWLLPIMMLFGDLWSGLNIADSDGAVRLAMVDQQGNRSTVSPLPISLDQYSAWKALGRNTLPATEALYLSNTDRAFWATYLSDSQTYFIQFNEVVAVDGQGVLLRSFSDQVATVIADLNPRRVVVDLRHNNGGNNTVYGPLLEALISDDNAQANGRLFVLIGRQTFSAGMNFATDLEQGSRAVFAGEISGGSPNQYGDSEPTLLSYSGMLMNISTIYHQFASADDPRSAITPTIFRQLNAFEYAAGSDPVLDAVIAAPAE